MRFPHFNPQLLVYIFFKPQQVICRNIRNNNTANYAANKINAIINELKLVYLYISLWITIENKMKYVLLYQYYSKKTRSYFLDMPINTHILFHLFKPKVCVA